MTRLPKWMLAACASVPVCAAAAWVSMTRGNWAILLWMFGAPVFLAACYALSGAWTMKTRLAWLGVLEGVSALNLAAVLRVAAGLRIEDFEATFAAGAYLCGMLHGGILLLAWTTATVIALLTRAPKEESRRA